MIHNCSILRDDRYGGSGCGFAGPLPYGRGSDKARIAFESLHWNQRQWLVSNDSGFVGRLCVWRLFWHLPLLFVINFLFDLGLSTGDN